MKSGDLSHLSFELPPEQTGAAAWYGPEMTKSTEWLMPLSAAETAYDNATRLMKRTPTVITTAPRQASSTNSAWNPSVPRTPRSRTTERTASSHA